MRHKNKKGWLRIIEAFISVLIVASVLIILSSRIPKQDRAENMHDIQRSILEQVSSNETLRAEILENDKTKTESFVENNLPVYLNSTVKICEISEVCGMPFYVEKEVYSDEILITANLTKFSPKKLKLFVWMK